ncbi:unnamed protein product [Effrenium voratum]|nr:unnamed protein product [Effrenium voratum]
MTALLGVGLGVNVIITLQRRAKRVKEMKKLTEEKISRTILDSVSNLNSLQFPMCLISCEDFLSCGRLQSHEAARSLGRLFVIDRPELSAKLCREEGVVFMSHQWAGFTDPDDAHGSQYVAMKVAVECLKSEGRRCGWVWVDYTSIPQENTFQQQAAINSLPVYATYCSIFISVVPKCTHGDTGDTLDFDSYRSRAWCRLEKLSYETCCWNAQREFYVCDGQRLSTEKGSGEDWFLHVLGGTFSCCARSHPGRMKCDKQKIVGVMLAVYWRLLSMQRDVPEFAARAGKLLSLISGNTEKYFPGRQLYTSDERCTWLPLFEGSVPVLCEMFEEDSMRESAQRLKVPGVNDPAELVSSHYGSGHSLTEAFDPTTFSM